MRSPLWMGPVTLLLAACTHTSPAPNTESACSAVVGCGGSSNTADIEGDAPRTSTPGLLASAEELEALLQAKPPRVVDARSNEDFAAAHIASAAGLDVSTLRAEVDGVPGQIPPAPAVAKALGSAGVELDAPVVVYAGATDLAAARLLWTLEYMGHRRVSLLDEGWTGWQRRGFATGEGSVSVAPTDFPSDRVDERRRVDADWVLDHLEDPNTVLVDARSSAEYASGHIPGATNVDWQSNVADGAMKSREELETLYAGVSRQGTVVAYCQSGSRASMGYFALRYLGYPDVRLYDGSMADWSSDPARPIE